jgi:hypothetical protein
MSFLTCYFSQNTFHSSSILHLRIFSNKTMNSPRYILTISIRRLFCRGGVKLSWKIKTAELNLWCVIDTIDSLKEQSDDNKAYVWQIRGWPEHKMSKIWLIQAMFIPYSSYHIWPVFKTYPGPPTPKFSFNEWVFVTTCNNDLIY